MKYERKLEKEIMFPVDFGLNSFGEKWKSRIICVLSAKAMRYNQIKRELSNITDAVLASMLKDLIVTKLVKRKQYNEIPPIVEYSLTEKGRPLLPILQSICRWLVGNAKEPLDKNFPHARIVPNWIP